MLFFETYWKQFVAIISIALILLYFKLTSVYSYFEKKGIPYVPGKFIFGSDVKGALLKISIGLSLDKMYNEMKNKKMFGMFIGFKPFLVVKDPDYVNKILIPDFEYFHDRGFMIDEEVSPLDAHLFFLNGNRWKLLRILLTPIFTSGKLKFMFPEMSKCSDILMEYLKRTNTEKDVDLKDLFGRFGTDVIATSAFGLEPESIKNPKNKFYEMGKSVFKPTLWKNLFIFLMFAAPNLIIRFKLNPLKKVHQFYLSLFREVFEYRRKSGKIRRDFIQLLLEVKEKKKIEINKSDGQSEIKICKDNAIEEIEITDNLLAAQSFVFLLAGFETTSDCLNYTTFLLSKHERVQEKARNEVKSVLKKFNGEYSYESLKEMTYLDQCITESTRFLPPVPQLNRIVAKNYTFPDGTVVEKGMNVIIPIYSIQRDEDYYKEPNLFDPDRFSEHTGKGLYLPFGDGPRHCIGKRFALVEIKMVLAKLLESYYLEESKLTKDPLEFQPVMQLTPSHPLYIKLIEIKK